MFRFSSNKYFSKSDDFFNPCHAEYFYVLHPSPILSCKFAAFHL